EFPARHRRIHEQRAAPQCGFGGGGSPRPFCRTSESESTGSFRRTGRLFDPEQRGTCSTPGVGPRSRGPGPSRGKIVGRDWEGASGPAQDVGHQAKKVNSCRAAKIRISEGGSSTYAPTLPPKSGLFLQLWAISRSKGPPAPPRSGGAFRRARRAANSRLPLRNSKRQARTSFCAIYSITRYLA